MASPLSIMLVEDEVITAMHIQSQLKNSGYAISKHVTTGEKAIIYARENRPDIILMDIRLAGNIDGIEAAEIIRSESDIPVIFITSYADDITKERIRSLNPHGFLEKPLEMSRLKKMIETSVK